MKPMAIVRGGILGGGAAAVVLATAGQLLDLDIPPWSWAPMSHGYVAVMTEWARAFGLILPAAVVLGLATALLCAVLFEYVSGRGGALFGAVIGLLLGVVGASCAGLVPWFAAWYGYAYMPSLAPLGPHDPLWPFVLLAATGVLVGAIAGRIYGSPVHALRFAHPIRWRQVYPAQNRFNAVGPQPFWSRRQSGVGDAADVEQ